MKRIFLSSTLCALILASSAAIAAEPCPFTYGNYAAANAMYFKAAERQRIVGAINFCKHGIQQQCDWLDSNKRRYGFDSSVIHDDAFVTEFTANANKALSEASDKLTGSASPTINCLRDDAINKVEKDVRKTIKKSEEKKRE